LEKGIGREIAEALGIPKERWTSSDWRLGMGEKHRVLVFGLGLKIFLLGIFCLLF
jgi:hypothetical protein